VFYNYTKQPANLYMYISYEQTGGYY